MDNKIKLEAKKYQTLSKKERNDVDFHLSWIKKYIKDFQIDIKNGRERWISSLLINLDEQIEDLRKKLKKKEVGELSEKEIEADRIEKDYEDMNLKPIKEMISFWSEGGEYLSCPSCGFIINGKDTIEASSIYTVINCGKCSESFEVVGKLIGYRKYKTPEELEIEEKGSE